MVYAKSIHDLPDLLAKAHPAGFECVYLILDLTGIPARPRTLERQARDIQQLIDMTVLLATRGVYLKLFLPEDLRPYLGDLSAFEVSSLTWSLDNLLSMLQSRIGAAHKSYGTLRDLCDNVPVTPDLDEWLGCAAGGSPRRLVHLGNELLKAHAHRHPDHPRLLADELDLVLGPINCLDSVRGQERKARTAL
jgi:hypothetical protein